MAAENAPKTASRRIAMLQAVLQPGMSDNPAKFEETWKSWEHQVDVYQNLPSSQLDDVVKIGAVLREAPQKLRDHLLVKSQHFEEAIIQAHLNTNKTWIANDFRETDPMKVYTSERAKAKAKQEQRQQKREQ